MDAETAFADTAPMMPMDAASLSCLDRVRIDFMNVFDDPVNMTLGQTEAAGLKVELEALYQDCKTELDNFKTDAETEMQTQITAYTDDTAKQEHKAKADFLRLIESSITKLHGLTSLTAQEKIDIKDLIVAKRTQFGTDVGTWAMNLKDAMDNLKMQTEDLTMDPPLIAGLEEQLAAKVTAFEEEMKTDSTAMMDPADSVIVALETYNTARLEEVND